MLISRDHDILCNEMCIQKNFLFKELTYIEGKNLFISIVGDLVEIHAFQTTYEAVHQIISITSVIATFFFFFCVCVCMDILVKCIVVAYHVVFPTQLESTQSDN